MNYNLSQIAEILSIDYKNDNAVIDTLLIDSRKLSSPKTSLFFALDGPRRNGHLFIKELYKKGVRCFIVTQSIDNQKYPEAFFLQVKNSLDALQKIAAHHRSRFNIEVIGITGSNGKTVVKEWLYQLMEPDKNIIRSPKSYNSQIGVPLSVWQMDEKNNLAIFEAGISRPGEMERLQKIIQPSIGILTNIGTAHSEGFENVEQKLIEKLKLFKEVKVFIANGDMPLLKKNIHQLSVPFFSWGYEDSNAVKIVSIQKFDKETGIILQHGNSNLEFRIPFTDDASVENAINCCVALLYLKYDFDVIKERMKTLHPVSMRLEFKKGINNCIIINDSYSADINSLSIALDFLQQQSAGKNKTVILSDFVGSKEEDSILYQAIVTLLKKHKTDRLIGIGEKMQNIMPALLKNNAFQYLSYSDTEDFLKHFHSVIFKEEAILIKGARIFGFEQIVSLLEHKAHQTILEINLDAIAHNLKVFQQKLKPATKIMVMVKAFAYGSGGAEVAGLLQFLKTDYLGVAYTDEGVELRKSGITIPIMVLNSEENAFNTITENHLEPDIFSFELLKAFEQHLRQEGIRNYPIHIEIETGMNRLGFGMDDVDTLGQMLKGSDYLKVVSVFSHLVASEDKNEDEFTLHQYNLLQNACEKLKNILGYNFIKHIANSSGISRFPQLQMDMVRLGIGLYGISGDKNDTSLQNVLTLKSTIAQIKNIKKGETVSYNRRGVAKEDSVIATVRIGYADGYSRRFGNGVGKMLIHNQLAPVMGTVCMDMTMLDVTHIADVKEGDEVIIFGEGLPVQVLAESIGTIPYEIMTGISQRVKRVYWGES